MKLNGQSETAPIISILLKHPHQAFISQSHIESQWRKLNYTGSPDYKKAVREYDAFISILEQTVEALHFLPEAATTGLDSIYVHDPVVITTKGAILSRMGKTERQAEPAACADYFGRIGIPLLGAIDGDGRLEGGDIVWFDDSTVAVGQGYRTNAEGIRQFSAMMSGLVEEIVAVPLPHWKGPADVMHLMSLISPIDKDMALVYSPLMPVTLRQRLLDKGMKLIEVPDEEFETMGCNVLTYAPRQCIVLDGNPVTRKRLEDEGVEIHTYKGEEISLKGAGGPTCLTRPLTRRQ